MKENWTDRQKNILKGLSSIGQEIAGFYEGALVFYFGDYPNGAYYLMHSAREIDGGIRDILSVDFIPKKEEKGRHKKSILFSLGVDELRGLAEDWFNVTKELHKYAHRRGAWKKPRQLGEVKPCWDKYEKLLERLVGSYYAITDRIDHVSRSNNSKKDCVIEFLHNILSIPVYNRYFFYNEDRINWFIPLKDKKYFSPDSILFDDNNNAVSWNVTRYLERISEQVEQNFEYGKELLDIIESLVKFSRETKKINNNFIWRSCVEIISNLPVSIIKENLQLEDAVGTDGNIRYGFKTWLDEFTAYTTRGSFAAIWLEENFLKKFLDDDLTIKYAEAIIDVLTRCRIEEKESRSVYDRSDVYMLHDTYFILDSFKKNAELIGQKCSDSFVYSLADKLKAVLEFKHSKIFNDFIIGDDVYRIMVLRVRSGETIDCLPVYSKNRYAISIKQFSSAQLKDAGFSKDTWMLKDIEPEVIICKKLDVVADTKDEFIAKLRKKLPKKIDWDSAENYKVRLDGLYLRFYVDFSQVWLDSLTNEPLGTTAREILTVILRNILLAKCKTNVGGCCKILNSFIGENYQFSLFKRLALFCTDKHWNKSSSKLLETFFKIVPNALDAFDYEAELFFIIEAHFKDFNAKLQKIILSSINTPPEDYQKNKKHLAYWNYKWYSALRNISEYKELYEKAKTNANIKDDNPYNPKKFESGDFTSRDNSPINKEAILNKPFHELIEYLNMFQESGMFEKEGLGMELHSAVKESPNHFAKNIRKFQNVPFLYVHSLLRGLTDACSENKEIEWEKILDFILDYIRADLFFKSLEKSQGGCFSEGSCMQILDDTANLIKAGCKDKIGFGSSCFDTVEKIFDLIFPYLKGEESPEIQFDSITYAINTTLGKTIGAFIHFSLKKARVNKNPKINWGKSKYNRFLDKGIEAYILLGLYLSNIRYLDEKYTDGLLKKLLSSKDNKNWEMFMEGYLFTSKLYHDNYTLLRDHYEQAISIDFLGNTGRSLVRHITLEYFYFDERLAIKNSDGQDSLFYKLLNSPVNKLDRWKEIVRFLWSTAQDIISKRIENGEQKESENKKIRDKIVGFWKWTYDNQKLVNQLLENDYNALQMELTKLTIVLDKIDEEAEKWIMQSISPFENEKHDSEMGFLIGYLSKFEDKESIMRAGKIYLKLIENNSPIYKQEDIITIVDKLYDKKYKDCADKISNTYGRRGYHFLKQSWEANNS